MPAIETIRWDNEGDFTNFLRGLEKKHHLDRHFLFETVPKSGHVWSNHITQTNLCFSCNNIKGKTLHLLRGLRYYFTYAPEYVSPIPQTIDTLARQYQEEAQAKEDEVAGPLIKDILKSNQREVEIATTENLLFFTLDITGGTPKSSNDFDPPDYLPVKLLGTPDAFGPMTTVSFVIDESFPNIFFYQSTLYQFMEV